jgi:3-oxoadipate enol-lactonase
VAVIPGNIYNLKTLPMNSILQENYAEINGIAVSYTDSGPKDAIAAVFIHGFGLDKSMWNNQKDFLSATNRVITYDIRGHGQSGVGHMNYTIDLFTEDLVSLLNHLNIDRAVLCGLSMGGYIALRTISLYPEKALGLILCDTKSCADNNDEKIRRFNQIKFIKTVGVTAFAAEIGLNLFHQETVNENSEKVYWAVKTLEKNNPDALCATLMALASRVDTSEYLKNITVPTLIVSGEKDKERLPLDAQYLNHFIAGSQLCTISGAGHLSNMENSEEFNRMVSEFFLNKLMKLTIEDQVSRQE